MGLHDSSRALTPSIAFLKRSSVFSPHMMGSYQLRAFGALHQGTYSFLVQLKPSAKCPLPFPSCYFYVRHYLCLASQVAWWYRIHLPMQGCRGREFDPWVREIPLEEEMATQSSILVRITPWTEEPGRLQSTGSQRIQQDCLYYNTQNKTNIFLSLFPPQLRKPFKLFMALQIKA